MCFGYFKGYMECAAHIGVGLRAALLAKWSHAMLYNEMTKHWIQSAIMMAMALEKAQVENNQN